MDVITGDETGLLKYLSNGSYYRYSTDQSREKGILQIKALYHSTSVSHTLSNAVLVLLRKNRELEVWKMVEHELIPYDSITLDIQNPCGLLIIQNSTSNGLYYGSILAYGSTGEVTIVNISDTGIESMNMKEYDHKSSISSSIITTTTTTTTTNDFSILNENINSLRNILCLKGPISAGASCTNGIVLGGNENDLKFYDSNTFQTVWEAKNVPYDKLRLRVPIWITAVDFLRPSECNISTGAKIVTGTGYKHVRIYDTRVSRQPVTSIDVSDEYRVTSIRPTPDGESVYVGDTAGGLYLWDLRTNRRKNTLKGSAGSIRDIQISDDGQYIASASLDRFVRLYSITDTNHHLEMSVYLKNRLNCCLLFENSQTMKSLKKVEEEEGEEEEDIIEEYADSDEDDDSGNDDEEDEEEEEDNHPVRKGKNNILNSTKPNNNKRTRR